MQTFVFYLWYSNGQPLQKEGRTVSKVLLSISYYRKPLDLEETLFPLPMIDVYYVNCIVCNTALCKWLFSYCLTALAVFMSFVQGILVLLFMWTLELNILRWAAKYIHNVECPSH